MLPDEPTETASQSQNPQSGEDLVGKRFGEFEVLELISSSMAFVYKARSTTRKGLLALKIPREMRYCTEETKRRFNREIELNSSQDHPNTVGVLNFGEVNGIPFYTMRFVNGLRLDRWVLQKAPHVRRRLATLRELCKIVASLHRKGHIHCDLKLGNVIIDEHDEVRLIDFGLTLASAHERASYGATDYPDHPLTTSVAGTPQFMAPEQTIQGKEVTPATDVYALGGILYWLLEETFAYPVGDSVSALETIRNAQPREFTKKAGIPAELHALVIRCLSKDPKHRPASAGELATLIESCLQRMGDDRRRRSSARRRLRTTMVLALLGLATGAFLIFLAIRLKRERDFFTGIGRPYQGIFSYADLLDVSVQTQSGVVANGRLATLFQPPKSLRVSGELKFLLRVLPVRTDFELRSSEHSATAWSLILNQYTRKPIQGESIMDTMMYAGQRDVATPVVQHGLKLYALLLSNRPYEQIQSLTPKMKIVGTRQVDRVKCTDVTWSEEISLPMSVPPGGAQEYKNKLKVQFTASVDHEGLIRRIETNANELIPYINQPDFKKLTIVQTHHQPEPGANVGPNAFDQTPPAKATEVGQLNVDILERPLNDLKLVLPN